MAGQTNLLNRRQFQLANLSGLLAGGMAVATGHWQMQTGDVKTSEDWTQWGGPNRNFAARPIDGSRPMAPPKLRWTRTLGKGHSAIVSDGDFGYSLHLEKGQEVLEKWPVDNGQPIWSFRYEVGFNASFSEYDGPHSTPVILDNRIIAVSIDAQVHSVDITSGAVIWKRDLQSDFGTTLPQSGYASSPLVCQDLVVLPTLGEAQSVETERYDADPDKNIPAGRTAIPGAVALDLQTGEERWRTQTFRSSHGSPIQILVDDQPMLVFHGMFELVGVDPRTGKILWQQLLRRQAADNVSFTPIWDSERNQFLISHGYCRFGTQAIGIERVKGVWRTSINWTNRQLQIVHTNAVLSGNTLVGTNHQPATLLVAIDVRDGGTNFRERGFGKSNFLAVGSQLLILDEGGELIAGQLSTEKWQEAWRLPVLQEKAWTVPSLVGSHLLLRDSSRLCVYRFG